MSLRYSQLPKKIRDQVDAQLGAEPKARRRDTTGTNDAGPCPYRCVACEDTFPSFTKWLKHSEVAGHARGEAILP